MFNRFVGASLRNTFRATVTASTTVSTFFVVNAAANAQTLPTLPPSRLPQPPQRPGDSFPTPEPAPPLIEVIPIPPPTFSPTPEIGETTIFVDGFTFVGNTVFSDEQLLEVAQPYLQREVTFSELIQLRSAITNRYVEQGYTTSGAFIPIAGNEFINPQVATVTIQVVEGTVEAIEFSGDGQLERYVRSRLKNAIAPVLNQSELEEALRLLQVDPLIERIAANLSAGSQFGSSILAVSVDGQPHFSLALGADNHRAPSAGSNQAVVQWQAANLLAAGERLTTRYSYTEGSDSFSAGLQFPVNARNGIVSFEYAQLNGQIVEAPLRDFEIETDSKTYGLAFRQPLVRRASDRAVEEFALGIAVNRLESATTLAGFPFPISPGAQADGTTRITEVSFLQEYLRQSRNQAVLARSQVGLGLESFNSTIGAEPDGQYLTWRGQALWLQQLSTGAQLRLNSDIQLSADPLVPLRQFALGGPTSIRGYRQDAVIADSGMALTAELEIPLLTSAREQQLSLIPFVGAGVGWNQHADRALDDSFLASVGIGTQYEWGDFTARVNYALPLAEVASNGDSLQERGLDFAVSYQLRF